MKQQLELSLYKSSRTQEKEAVYQVKDLEGLSASALYYGTGGSPLGSSGTFGIVPTRKGFVVPIGNLGIEDLKDIHETYKVDKDGNVSYGHTTLISEKGTKRISHDE